MFLMRNLITILLLSCTLNVFAFVPGRQQSSDNRQFLITETDNRSWTVGIRYACSTNAETQNWNINDRLTRYLQEWTRPLREQGWQTPAVDNITFVHLPKRGRISGVLNSHKPDNLGQFSQHNLDLRITIRCKEDGGNDASGVTFSSTAHPPDIYNADIYWINSNLTLFHELGHVFGFGDAYFTAELPSTGNISDTRGSQPASVMSGAYNSGHEKPILSQDDYNGMIWLYKNYNEGLSLNDCFFTNYKLEKSPYGCVPKYPLIFEIQSNRTRYIRRILSEDPNVDVNARDEMGSTALFWASKLGEYTGVNSLLREETTDINIKNNEGLSPLDIAVQENHGRIVNKIVEHQDDWTVLEANPPDYQRSVFLLQTSDKSRAFHAAYLGTVRGGDSLFIVRKSKKNSIDKYVGKNEFILYDYEGIVAEQINVKVLEVFTTEIDDTGNVVLAIRDIDFDNYTPLELAKYPDDETDLVVLNYRDRGPLKQLEFRDCYSITDLGLQRAGLGKHTCIENLKNGESALIFDKSEHTFIGFASEISRAITGIGEKFPVADTVTTKLVRYIEGRPVTPKDKIATTWGALKSN